MDGAVPRPRRSGDPPVQPEPRRPGQLGQIRLRAPGRATDRVVDGTVGGRPYGVDRASSPYGRLARRQVVEGPEPARRAGAGAARDRADHAGAGGRRRARGRRPLRQRRAQRCRATPRGPHADGAGAHRGAGRRDRGEPRPRRHLRRVPALRRGRGGHPRGVGADGRDRRSGRVHLPGRGAGHGRGAAVPVPALRGAGRGAGRTVPGGEHEHVRPARAVPGRARSPPGSARTR